MGEEAKQEEVKAEVKPEEMPEDKKEEEKKAEAKPPSPFVLQMDLHCAGCAKKIEKSILRIRGVESVVIDMTQNQMTIKGVVEPQAVCAKIMKRTKRRAQVLSPLSASEGEQPVPDVVNSQVSGLTTVELIVNMHCEACAEQLKKIILRMRGVRTATTELSSSKVTVTGTVDPNVLVDYVYRRTKKQAKIIPQPEPEPEDEPKSEEKKEEKTEPEPEEKPEEKKEEKPANKNEETKEGESDGNKEEKGEENKEEVKKPGDEEQNIGDEQAMQRMVHYYHPLYVIERIPPPQLFSDENPNACCIT